MTSNHDVEAEPDCFFNPDLFVNKSLVKVNYSIQDLEQQPVWVSAASCTDHDQTGEIVWPISIFLSWFVAARRDLFRDQQVIELGAGCAGLPGLIASRFAKDVLVTDGNYLVLETLQRNVAETRGIFRTITDHSCEPGEPVEPMFKSTCYGQSTYDCSVGVGDEKALNNNSSAVAVSRDALTSCWHEKGKLETRTLLWGDKESVEAVVNEGWRPQILLGADIVCWIDFVTPLLQTVKFLFLHAPDRERAVLFLGFVNRANSTERFLYAQARAFGMSVKRVPHETFMPIEKRCWPSELQTAQELEVLSISLDPTLEGYDSPVSFEESRAYDWATPC
ncbi:methyltransferase-like protein 21a-like isoform 2 [Nannochloropsis gaditana]|uniref:Methyltransferase-like protein 21a-like isoform 2 n=1 Tax=Nannochloropsis gaditana TaxID=72520 RepID=W7TUH9_9STRA|nr:methyltransferase-like protein 21a-like isoform 2 [Nannochloropsis gaditana]